MPELAMESAQGNVGGHAAPAAAGAAEGSVPVTTEDTSTGAASSHSSSSEESWKQRRLFAFGKCGGAPGIAFGPKTARRTSWRDFCGGVVGTGTVKVQSLGIGAAAAADKSAALIYMAPCVAPLVTTPCEVLRCDM